MARTYAQWRQGRGLGASGELAAGDADPMRALYELKLSAIWQAFRAQSVGFKLACIYLILEYIRPQSIWPAMDVLPWSKVTIILGCLAMLAEVGERGWTRSTINWQIVLFGFVIAVSLAFAPFPLYGLQQWDMFVPWLVVFFFLTNTVTGRVRFFLFLLLFMLASFKMSQHGFRGWASTGFRARTWGVTGAPGWFRNSGEVGIQMCIFLPVSAFFWWALHDYWPRWKQALVALLPVTAAATIIGSNSRGAVIGAAAVLFWVLTIGRSRFKAIAIILLLGAVAYWFIPPGLMERFHEIGHDQTSESRLYYWTVAMDVIKHNPVIGIGYWNWIPYFMAHYPPFAGYEHAPSGGYQLVHNFFLQATTELGFIGLAVLILILVTVFAVNRGSHKIATQTDQPFLGFIALGLNAGMIGFLVSAQFITVLYYPYLWIHMVLTVCLRVAVDEKLGQRLARPWLSRRKDAGDVANASSGR